MKQKILLILVIFIISMSGLAYFIHNQFYPMKTASLYGETEINNDLNLTFSSAYNLINEEGNWEIENITSGSDKKLECYKNSDIGPVVYISGFQDKIRFYCRYYYIEVNAFSKTKPKDIDTDNIRKNISESINDIFGILEIEKNPQIEYGDEDIFNFGSYSLCCGVNLIIFTIPLLTFFYTHKRGYIIKEFLREWPTKRSIKYLSMYSISFIFFYISLYIFVTLIYISENIGSYILRILFFLILGITLLFYTRSLEKKNGKT